MYIYIYIMFAELSFLRFAGPSTRIRQENLPRPPNEIKGRLAVVLWYLGAY